MYKYPIATFTVCADRTMGFEADDDLFTLTEEVEDFIKLKLSEFNDKYLDAKLICESN